MFDLMMKSMQLKEEREHAKRIARKFSIALEHSDYDLANHHRKSIEISMSEIKRLEQEISNKLHVPNKKSELSTEVYLVLKGQHND